MVPSNKRGTDRRATAADVARLSGVSRATVSYVLNDSPGQSIPAATRERVHAAARKLAYVPSAAAASLRRGHSQLVVIVVESALLGYAADQFLRAAFERLAELGLAPLLHHYTTDDALRALVDSIRPYGVIALMSHREELLDELRATGVPQIYSSAHGNPAYPRPWEEEIGGVQVRHLIDRGFHRLAYARPPIDSPRSVIARAREVGAGRGAAAAGHVLAHTIEVAADLTQTTRVLRPLLQESGPLGICAFDDDVAAEVLAALRELGRSIPDEVGVVGVDDAPVARFLSPPLSTVALDMRRTGRTLVERFMGTLPAVESGAPASAHARVVARAST
jgi:DNA-binding LacI/PurR family transcriptional regulator